MKEEMLAKIYKNGDGYSRPSTLFHTINGENKISELGLLVSFSSWSDIDEILPLRPKGNFFWGEEMSRNATLSVSVSDLDTARLWAFPAIAASTADEVASGFFNDDPESKALLIEVFSQVHPVSWADYDGSFAAEWIYTADVPANLIKFL